MAVKTWNEVKTGAGPNSWQDVKANHKRPVIVTIREDATGREWTVRWEDKPWGDVVTSACRVHWSQRVSFLPDGPDRLTGTIVFRNTAGALVPVTGPVSVSVVYDWWMRR